MDVKKDVMDTIKQLEYRMRTPAKVQQEEQFAKMLQNEEEQQQQIQQNNNQENEQQNKLNTNMSEMLLKQKQQHQQLKRKNEPMSSIFQQNISSKARVLNSQKILFQNIDNNSNSNSQQSRESAQSGQNNQQNNNSGSIKKGLKKQDSKITQFFEKKSNQKKRSPQQKKEEGNVKQNSKKGSVSQSITNSNTYNSNLLSNINQNNNDIQSEQQEDTNQQQYQQQQQIKSNKNSIDQQDINQYLKIDQEKQEENNENINQQKQDQQENIESEDKTQLQKIISQLKQEMVNKDKELNKIKTKNQQLENQVVSNKNYIKEFRTQVTSTLQKCLIEKQKLFQSDRKSKAIQKKHRLGEFVLLRDGTKFDEQWVDGYEIKNIKNKLEEIKQEKIFLEQKKKNLKVVVNKKGKNGQKQTGGDFYNNLSGNNSESNSSQSMNGYNLIMGENQNQECQEGSYEQVEEQKKIISFQISMLQKEEQLLTQQFNKLQYEKYFFMKESKLIQEEEHSKYAGEIEANKLPVLGNQYQILCLIGKGGFSEVYKAFDLINLRDVAIKIHSLNNNWNEMSKVSYINHALRETEVQKQLNHPNIVKLYDTIEIDGDNYATVQEFCDGQDLYQQLKMYNSFIEKDAKIITKQIVSGLAYMNSYSTKIIHYDLKPQNIIFHQGEVKIADFGLCKIMDTNNTRMELTSQGVGTYWYLPPECFVVAKDEHEPEIQTQQNPQNAQKMIAPKISTKVDVWSVGVILYEMIYGVKPFGNSMSQQQIWKDSVILNSKQVKFPPKPTISNECKDFIIQCLKYEQSDRINVQDALNHPFLAGGTISSFKNNNKQNNNNSSNSNNINNNSKKIQSNLNLGRSMSTKNN